MDRQQNDVYERLVQKVLYRWQQAWDKCLAQTYEYAIAALEETLWKLYRKCLRQAKYIGSKKYNSELLISMVREKFKRHMHEINPEMIQKLKDDATQGLINHMLHELESLSGWKFSKSS